MSDGILKRVIEESLRPSIEAKTESYTMVNVRPGEKVSALLDLLSRLAGMTPSAMMADRNRFSAALANYAASSAENGPAILNAAAAAIEQDGGLRDRSALEILKEHGIIEVENLAIKSMLKDLSRGKPAEP